MTWHIADYIERGEIENRERDTVTGRIWLRGLDEPIELDLVGNALDDVAGRCLRFQNPFPEEVTDEHRPLAGKQQGTVGKLTAAQKIRVWDIPFPDPNDAAMLQDPRNFHWANGLYLEWHCTRNGRILIESTEFELAITAPGQAPEAGDPFQHGAKPNAVAALLNDIVERAAVPDPDAADDAPQGLIEREAEADMADFELIRARIAARLNREDAIDAEVQIRITIEERARLRRERGLPELKPDSPEADEAEAYWLNEVEATTEELFEADLTPLDEESRHPLVERTQALSLQLADEIEDSGWATEHATTEHPLHEVTNSLCAAAAKLAGALFNTDFWPQVCYPGPMLVRLKRARSCLRDAHDALQAARQETLAPTDWINASEREVAAIRQKIQAMIDEIRGVLRADEARRL